jgi:hypothetical protein
VEGTLPDATFGGILPDMDAEMVERELLRSGLLLTRKPTFVWLPVSRVVDPGADVVLPAEAEAAFPFQYQWRKDETELPGKTAPQLMLSNVTVADAGYYSLVAWNAHGEAVTPPARVVVTVPLAEALDLPVSSPFTPGHGWIGQTLVTRDGVSAVETAPGIFNRNGWMSLEVQGPGSLSFWWKLELENWWGGAIAFHSGGESRQLEATTDWQEVTAELGAGAHYLHWSYGFNDRSLGWIDQLVFVPSGGFAAWAEALPPGQRGRDDDPGGRGIPNWARYAFGMDPLQPDREALPRIERRSLPSDPHDRLSLTYKRRKDDPSLSYMVEASDELLFWDVLRGSAEIFDDGNGQTETVVFTDNRSMVAASKRFLRVRVGD